MVALPSRDEHESRLLRLLGRAGRDSAQRILDALGDPPDLSRLTPELWRDIEAAYQGALLPELEAAFVDAAEAAMTTAGVGVDWTLVNQNAATWARQYSFDLVRGLNANTQAFLQQAVNDFFQTGMTNRDLQARIARVFGAQRAQSIAITEVTRAATEGERAVVREIERAGLRMAATWHTVRDGAVCMICEPRDQRKQGDGWQDFPPAHVRCRCFVSWSPAEVAT